MTASQHVAQVSNLLYRRLPVGRTSVNTADCGFPGHDTAAWPSAFQGGKP